MDMNMPKVSVIVPVYNSEKWLQRCLDSILVQTFDDFELLLINDGSNDNSLNICEKYARKDVRVKVFDRLNHGVGATRNFGIEQASGAWVCFVDSDDWIAPDHLAAFFREKIDKNAMPSQGIVFDYCNEKPNHPFFEYDDIVISSDDLASIAKYAVLHNGCPFSKLFNREILIQNNVRFDEILSIHEDHCFVTDYIKYVDRIVLSSSLSYHYVQNPDGGDSLTHRRHSSEVYLRSSRLLRQKFSELHLVKDNADHPYIKGLIMKYGIRQLVNAYNSMNDASASDVMREMKNERRHVIEYMGLKGIRRILWSIVFSLHPKISLKLISVKHSFK